LSLRQPDHVHLIGDGQHDFQAELATSDHAWNLAVLIPRPAIDFVSDQHRLTVFQPPHAPRVREFAVACGDGSRKYAGGKHLLRPHRQRELVGRADPAPPQRPIALPLLPTASPLPLLLGRKRKRLRDLLGRPRGELPLQLRDPLVGPLQPLVERHDQIAQPIHVDPPATNVVPELLNVHTSFDNRLSQITQRRFQRMDSYCPANEPHYTS
jgi:hypothetical protein